MSDRDEFLDQFDTVAAALHAGMKLNGKACPMCENDDWKVEVRQKEQELVPAPVFLLKDTGSWFGPSPAIPAIAFSCGNCGFIRLHNIPILTASLDSSGGSNDK